MSIGHRNDDLSKFKNIKKKANEGFSASDLRAMAIAKPVRALAVVSAILFVYLIYVVFKPSQDVNGPGALEQALPNEPTLEGIFEWGAQGPWTMLTASRDTRTPGPLMARRRLRCGQSQRSSHQRDPASIGTK